MKEGANKRKKGSKNKGKRDENKVRVSEIKNNDK